MKHIATAAALLALAAGTASAQSSVTLFGVVDLSANSIKTGPNRASTLDGATGASQLQSNRLGFRGVEDLGGGMTAGFWLEGGLDTDIGAVGGGNGVSATPAFFNRRSTVSLTSGFGEVRLGRDYNPSNWNQYTEAFGGNGYGGLLYMVLDGLGSGAKSLVRSNNSVTYFLPGNLGGVYGRFMVAAGEGVAGQKYTGGLLGYTAGPLNVSAALGNTKTATPDDYKVFNLGASYDLGVAKVYGLWDQAKYGAKKRATYEISTSVPIGTNEFRAAYIRANASGAGTDANDGTKIALEYIHNLTKRTALYTQYGRVTNKGAATYSLTGSGGVAGQTMTGYGAGVRHTF